MLKIGLTGGIGSGKTIVANIFSALSIPVFDADREAKLLMQNDKELAASLRNAFGEMVFKNDRLNRTELARIVFEDAYKLEMLNSLVHPAIIEAARKWMDLQNAPYIIKEAALMFEAGSTQGLDFVIGVSAPQKLRIKRAMERDNASWEQVLARMNRQINEQLKMKLCDFVVVNDEQELLIPQVLALHEKFTKEYQT